MTIAIGIGGRGDGGSSLWGTGEGGGGGEGIDVEGGIVIKTIGDDGVVPSSACRRPIVMPNTMPKATQTMKVMNMIA